MSDISTCSLPELVQAMREAAENADKQNNILKCLLMNSIANRFQAAHDRITELEKQVDVLKG